MSKFTCGNVSEVLACKCGSRRVRRVQVAKDIRGTYIQMCTHRGMNNKKATRVIASYGTYRD